AGVMAHGEPDRAPRALVLMPDDVHVAPACGDPRGVLRDGRRLEAAGARRGAEPGRQLAIRIGCAGSRRRRYVDVGPDDALAVAVLAHTDLERIHARRRRV